MNRIIVLFLISAASLFGIDKGEWNIYLDADMTTSKSSGDAIRKGIELALENFLPEDIKINLIVKDHRGNSLRSLGNLEEASKDPKMIAVFSGLHSPPVLANLNFINENSILLLDPWAAATPITRTPDKNGKNWVFRLSIDDSLAGETITAYSLDKEKFSKPILLLEDTGWGKANEKTFKKAIAKRGLPLPEIIWFDWKVGRIGIKQIVSTIKSSDSDVIFMVANSNEGKQILRELAGLERHIPVRSHWGITGGDTFEAISAFLNEGKLDLKFIQTSFLFTNKEKNSYQLDTWDKIKERYPEIKEYKDLTAPLGFIHAYDMTKIFIQVVKETPFSESLIQYRDDLRAGLEQFRGPVEGLIKEYFKPFIYSHEALGITDFKMAEYDPDGSIRLSK